MWANPGYLGEQYDPARTLIFGHAQDFLRRARWELASRTYTFESVAIGKSSNEPAMLSDLSLFTCPPLGGKRLRNSRMKRFTFRVRLVTRMAFDCPFCEFFVIDND